MILSNLMANDPNYNPKPKHWRQKMDKMAHENKLSQAKRLGICPGCQRKLTEDSVLYDRGYMYGIECEFCR